MLRSWIAVMAVVLLALSSGPDVWATVTITWVTVGDAGNVADDEVMSGDGTTGYGSVPYAYRISKYEITNGQYIEFLNAVGTVGPLLYGGGPDGEYTGITRTGSGTAEDPYIWGPMDGDAGWLDRPVNDVSWLASLRFANWMHNGQPTGVQDATTTEDGAYDLSPPLLPAEIVRKPGARFFLTSEDEWYKAAYYDPSLNDGAGGYWDYPTASDSPPTPEACPGGSNSANFNAITAEDPAGFVEGPPYYMSVVGCYAQSASAYGTFNQAGNVSEWNEARILWEVEPGVWEVWYGWRGTNWLWGHPDIPCYLGRSRDRGMGPNPEGCYNNTGFRIAGQVDTDEDGLGDMDEFLIGTNPEDPDSDDDGLLDGTEVDIAEGGGCPDPLVFDSDGDTLSDGDEVALGTNPCETDSDGDGVPDNTDPLPTEPGVTSGFIEDALRGFCDDITDFDLALIDGKNDNARAGRQNAMCNKVNAAANAVAAENYQRPPRELSNYVDDYAATLVGSQ